MIFKEIFDRYYLPVKSYGFQYVEDDEIIEDFVQDAFLKVWEKRADFYFVAAIKSFLYMSVRNACLDYLRHQKVQRRNEPELILWLTEEGARRPTARNPVASPPPSAAGCHHPEPHHN